MPLWTPHAANGIPIDVLNARAVADGFRRALVICDDCKAPLGIVACPPAQTTATRTERFGERLATLGNLHVRQHPATRKGAGARLNLVEEERLAEPGTLVNLVGPTWAATLEKELA